MLPLLLLFPRLRPERAPTGLDGLQALVLLILVLPARIAAHHDEHLRAVKLPGKLEHAPRHGVFGTQPPHLVDLLSRHVVLLLAGFRRPHQGR